MQTDESDAAEGGITDGSSEPSANENLQQSRRKRNTEAARRVAAEVRAARARNDAAYVPTPAHALRVMLGIAMGRSLRSIAAGLMPPYGITVPRLREAYPYECKHGAEEARQTILSDEYLIARGVGGPTLSERLRALKNVGDQLLAIQKQFAEAEAPAQRDTETVVQIAPVLGENEPK